MPTTTSHPRRRASWRRAVAATAIATGLLGAAACSSPAPSRSDLSAALVASGLSRKVADCTAAALTGSLTSAELAELTERGSGGAPVDDPKATGENADKLTAAMAKCRDLQIADQPTTTTTTAPAGEGAGSSTTLIDGTGGAELNPASTTTTAP